MPCKKKGYPLYASKYYGDVILEMCMISCSHLTCHVKMLPALCFKILLRCYTGKVYDQCSFCM